MFQAALKGVLAPDHLQPPTELPPAGLPTEQELELEPSPKPRIEKKRKKRRPPVKYSAEIAQRVLDELASPGDDGKIRSLNEICAEQGMPTPRAIHLWRSRYPDFQRQYEIALSHRMELVASEIVELADRANPADWQVRKLQIDTRKFLMASFSPGRFGKRMEVKQEKKSEVKITFEVQEPTYTTIVGKAKEVR